MKDRRWLSGWPLPASVILHGAVVLLVLFGLPTSLLPQPEEQSVSVELVPPKPPEKPGPEAGKAAPPPPPKASATEKPETPAAKTPTPGDRARETQAPPVFKPVVQFGEKDAGPREALDGDSAEEPSSPAAPSPEADRQASATKSTEPPGQAPDQAAQPLEKSQTANSTPADAVEKDDAKAGTGQSTASGAQDRKASADQPAGKKSAQPPIPTEPVDIPKPKPDNAVGQEKAVPSEVKKLFSQQATGGAVATTAMAGIPRGVRAGRLCVTELREQMLHTVPPRFPDLLPSYELKSGTVLEVPRAAFRMGGEWYDLSFRCAVDPDATKVVSFAFDVGGVLAPSERVRRKLPAR